MRALRERTCFPKKGGIAFDDVLIDKSGHAKATYAQLNEKVVPMLATEKKMVAGFNEELYAQPARLEN